MDNSETKKPILLTKKKSKPIPITYSKNPDLMALSGIWKDKDITLEELREKAWGKR